MIEWIVSSSVLIVAILILRRIFRDKVSKRLQYALWVLVLLRLLIPGSLVESAASVGNLLSDFQEQPVIQVASGTVSQEEQYDLAFREVLSAHDYSQDVFSALPQNRQESITQEFQPEIQQRIDDYTKAYDTAQILNIIWIVGALIMGLCLVFVNLHFGLRLRRNRTQQTSIGSVQVYISALVHTPCLFGIFRPAIYLPEDMEGNTEHVLAHEQTHYRHLDHIWAILRCLCLAIHWYNPLVWIAVKISRTDSELACDEGTLRFLGSENRESYGRTLIEMSRGKPSMQDYLLTATTMTGDKKSLYQRIRAIAQKPKFILSAVIILAVVSLVIVGCTFTSSQKGSSTSTDPAIIAPTGSTTEISAPPVLSKDDPIPWTVPNLPEEMTYEEYFATEWYNHGTYPKLAQSIIDDSGVYTPHVKDGKLLVRHSYQKKAADIFQVGTETYSNLLILGTDKTWIYCIEDGKEFFRINPYGEKDTLFLDEKGKLPRSSESDIVSRVCFYDSNRLIVFVAGCGNVYGVYRLYIPTKTIDCLGTSSLRPVLRNPISNHQITWRVGTTNFTSPSPFHIATEPAETEPQETIPEIIPDVLVRMMDMLYILDEEESVSQKLPAGYLYLGYCYENNDNIPKWNNGSCNIPSFTEFYASLDDPDYIYYRTEGGYQRMIRASLVENLYSKDDPDNTAPEDYELAFFNTLLRGDSGNIYNQATGMEYHQPEGANLHWLFYNGFNEWHQSVLPLTDAEKTFLAAHGWGDEMPIGNAHRFPISAMDQQLRKFFGITYAQSWKVGTDTIGDYRQENQCYYRWVSDTRGYSVTVESVESNTAKTVYHITHTCSDYTGNTYCMTLIKTGGLFQIYSNVIVATSKP